MSTIASGDQTVAIAKTAVVVTSAIEFERLWAEWLGPDGGAAPKVDFENGVALFLFAGQRNTGGWSIAPEEVTVAPDGTARIVAPVHGPGAGAIATQVLTSPYTVVFVKNRQIKNVLWSE